VLVVNFIFLMVVYLSLLNVTAMFGAGKTSLDFFAAYIVVVSLLFGEMVRLMSAISRPKYHARVARQRSPACGNCAATLFFALAPSAFCEHNSCSACRTRL
jgi:hypothetical protein